MSVNKFKPHVWIIPEDDANRQVAVGFIGNPHLKTRTVDVRPCAGGWLPVLEIFESEFISYLREYPDSYVILLLDFDGNGDIRKTHCFERVPEDLKNRVFLLGAMETPEKLKRELHESSERIGELLAEDCTTGEITHWCHPHLVHNLPELNRLLPILKPIVFPNL
jgi:hypothetical protein